MLYAVIPETTRRELLAYDNSASLQQTVTNAQNSSISMIQRQRVVDDIVRSQLEEIKYRVRHVKESAHPTQYVQHYCVPRA